MLIPEITILNTVQSFFAWIVDDYCEAEDKNTTFLADIFSVDDNGNNLAISYKDSLLKSAVQIFCSTDDTVDKLDVHIGYNRERMATGAPSIHILLPSENKGRMDTLGNSSMPITDGTTVFIDKQKSKQAVYHLMITSGNPYDIIVVYYALQALFLIFDFHLEQAGLRNFKVSGADINMQADLDTNIFHRNCTIEFDYEYHVKTRIAVSTIGKMKFNVCADYTQEQQTYALTGK